MTTFAQHRAAFESFIDCMHAGADKDAIARCLAENVVLISPLSDEPLTGREAVTAAIQGVSTAHQGCVTITGCPRPMSLT